jgi:hypothetical protein
VPRSFEKQLDFGRVGEKLVARFLQRKGCGVLPSYDYAGSDGQKAPRLMFEVSGLVVPDLDAAKQGARKWIEVKTYSHSPLFRAYGIRIHGIRRRHYRDYLAVEEQTGNPVFLAIVEVESSELLIARLRELKVYWCRCKACVRAGSSQPNHAVYFDRAAFSVWTKFPEREMAKLREMADATRKEPVH